MDSRDSSTSLVKWTVLMLIICTSLPASSPISVKDNMADSPSVSLGAETDYVVGDPRRCTEVARRNGYHIERFEVLPGFGWDNLRNLDQGQVIAFNFSECRTTDDGRFLLPDYVSSVPIKTSNVQTFAEFIEHWQEWTSTTSKSVNVNAGLDLSFVSISGKFSSSFETMKSKQIGDNSVTTRAQVRYVRYAVHLQPDAPLHKTFRGRLLEIAAMHELNQTEQARYLSQLLVRDFGTHVITHADAGAALVQEDQINKTWATSESVSKQDILIATSLSLFSIFHVSASYETKSSDTFKQSYLQNRMSSETSTLGGPPFKLANFTPDSWINEIDGNLVALDRSGDPLYYLITTAALPELMTSTLNQVVTSVREAITAYYTYNRVPGCVQPGSSNFNPAANVDDGTCHPPSSNMTFGGLYQTCGDTPDLNDGNLCPNIRQVNPLTGTYSCPQPYQSVLLKQGTVTVPQLVHECHTCWLFFHCCSDRYVPHTVTYNSYWCAAKGPVPQETGYLFGGLYTSETANLITRSKSCPPNFFDLKMGSTADIHVCVSDDFDLGANFAVPFAGFLSCSVGNPLTVIPDGRQQLQKISKKSLRSFINASPNAWPQTCPENYSKHLAAIDQGCEIDYCVHTGALSGPVLPPVVRPPFMVAPQFVPSSGSMVVFDSAARTWYKDADAQTFSDMKTLSSSSRLEKSAASPSTTLSPGSAAGIAVGGTVAVIALVAFVVIVVRSRRRRSGEQYHLIGE